MSALFSKRPRFAGAASAKVARQRRRKGVIVGIGWVGGRLEEG